MNRPGQLTAMISSTAFDLPKHRKAAVKACLRAGIFPIDMDDLPARDATGIRISLEMVDKADIYIGIYAWRYGWVPDFDNPNKISITEMEFDHALKRKIPILVFVIHKDHALNINMIEVKDEAQKKLETLKQRAVRSRGRSEFKSVTDLGSKIFQALADLKERAAATPLARSSSPSWDTTKYLRHLRDICWEIDIRGLHVVTADVHRFGMDDLYIPLRFINTEHYVTKQTTPRGLLRETDAWKSTHENVKETLQNQRLVIVADPGAGKTTSLKRFGYLLCLAQLDEKSAIAEKELGLPRGIFPILIRLSKLAEHILASQKQARGPTIENSAEWLIDFLAITSKEQNLGLSEEFFRARLKKGPAIVLFDGLDEAPSEASREKLANLIKAASDAYNKCRFIVTSRPGAYKGEAIIPSFTIVQIEPLDNVAIERFLSLWYRSLFRDASAERIRHAKRKLIESLRARPDLFKMARNPVMLTALAVVHWSDNQQMPEQRAELYESIVNWLSRARKERPGRSSPKRAVILLQELALQMQCAAEGRKFQIPQRTAAEKIADEFRAATLRDRLEQAELFLQEEESDSGIVVSRGRDICFWHPTFQEYLAGRAIASRADKEQIELLSTRCRTGKNPRLFAQEWREVVLLLFGILYTHGHPKVDRLLGALLKRLGPKAPLVSQTRFVALLGAVAADLASLNYIPDYSYFRGLFRNVGKIYQARFSKDIPIEIRIQAAEVLGRTGDHRFSDLTWSAHWITIPAGKFLMGSQKGKPSDPNFDPEALNMESPVHEVFLDRYQIGRYPVTVTDYLQFVQEGGYSEPKYWQEGIFEEWDSPDKWEAQLNYPNRPVVGVSWYEAAAFAQWAGCRLPSEAEWERAARGRKGRRYPWGNKSPNSALMNYGILNVGHPTPVGVYPDGATAEGMMDGAGNVWEWCKDWFHPNYYAVSPRKNPTGPPTTKARVMRGGAWDSVEFHCRSAYRDCFRPMLRPNVIGFRLAR